MSVRILEPLRKIMDEYNVLVDFDREPEIEDPLLAELWRFLKSWIVAYERLQISLRTRYGLMRVKKEDYTINLASPLLCCMALQQRSRTGDKRRIHSSKEATSLHS